MGMMSVNYMLTKMICEYYIARVKDIWWRFGFHGGDKKEHLAYLDSISPEVNYIGDLLMPLKSDVDVGSGLGTHRINESTIVTCRFVKMMMQIKQQDKPFIKQQEEMIISVKRIQVELFLKQEEKLNDLLPS